MTDALTDRLRAAASAGYDEWRVQDPKDGAFCIAYSWPDTMSPEREARAWLADHKARFPDSPKAGYLVACVRVVPLKDRLLAEAADEIERLRAALAAPAVPPADWSVFNDSACVADGLTYAEALDYLTPERLQRGWSAVCVANRDNIVDAAPTAQQEPARAEGE